MSKTLDRYIKKLYEDQLSYTGLAFFRPDTSGIRGKGVNRKAYQAGDDKYPYGDAEPNWGEPWSYSRDSKGGSMRQPVPIPKQIDPDDSRWDDLKEIGMEGWSSGTPIQGNIVDNPPRSRSKFGIPDEKDDPWNDKTTEALGVPFNVAKAGQGTGGQHSGGRVMPGTSGQWSSRPKGDHWDNHMDDDELTKAVRKNEYNYGMPFARDISTKVNPRQMVSDPELDVPSADTIDLDNELRVQLQFGDSDFGITPGQSIKYSRMQPGFTWRESVHRKLVEAFVSMADTPCGSPDLSQKVSDVDLDMARDSFMAANDKAKRRFDKISEPELVSFMLQIEPDYFVNSLGKIGKDKLVDIYEKWAADVLSKEGNDIERMAERITKACGVGEEE